MTTEHFPPGTDVVVLSIFSRQPLPGRWQVTARHGVDNEDEFPTRVLVDLDSGRHEYVSTRRMRLKKETSSNA